MASSYQHYPRIQKVRIERDISIHIGHLNRDNIALYSCQKNNLILFLGESLATRQAYGNAIVKIAQNNDRVVALDGDMKNSTFSQNLRKVFPERHVECFICEQNLAGVSGINLLVFRVKFTYRRYYLNQCKN